ncbi:unnamed protein product, partial [Discosporangium mesarthrocarpum]
MLRFLLGVISNQKTLGEERSTCNMSFAVGNMSFYSDCECVDIPQVVEGRCSLDGFTFDASRDGTAFAPDFPASSTFVTSVGATQAGPCSQ